MSVTQTRLGGCCRHGDWDQSCPICNTTSLPFHERIDFMIDAGMRPAAEQLLCSKIDKVRVLAKATETWIKAKDIAMKNPSLMLSDTRSHLACAKVMEDLSAAEQALVAALNDLNQLDPA